MVDEEAGYPWRGVKSKFHTKRGQSFKRKPDGEVFPCDVSVKNLEKRHTYLHTFSVVTPLRYANNPADLKY